MSTKIKNLWGYWYSLLLVAFVFAGITGILDQYSYEGGWVEAPLYAKILIPTMLVTFFGFWFLMLADFFKTKDTKFPVLVGFSLLFFSWFAIFIYFWVVVNRRNRGAECKI